MDAKYLESLCSIYAALYKALEDAPFFFSLGKVIFCDEKVFDELFPDSKEEHYCPSTNTWERHAELGGLPCIMYVNKENPDDL